MLNTCHTIHTDKRRFTTIKIKVNYVPIVGVAGNHLLTDRVERHKSNALVSTNHLLVVSQKFLALRGNANHWVASHEQCWSSFVVTCFLIGPLALDNHLILLLSRAVWRPWRYWVRVNYETRPVNS